MSRKKIDLDKLKELIVHPKIGEILLQKKKISLEQLGQGLEEQKNIDSPIGQILINKGFITENDLVELLSIQQNIDILLKESYEELEKLNNEFGKN